MNLTMDLRGGGLGDNICAEPIVRFAKERYYPNLQIKTNHPEVFKHLSVGINTDIPTELNVSSSPWNSANGKISMHPFAEYIQSGQIHMQDFMSLFMLRQALPDKYKVIQLPVSRERKDAFLKRYPTIEDTWLLHAGFGDPMKSFGANYWKNISCIARRAGIKTGLIGKDLKRDHFFGSYPIEVDLDLNNKLTLEETITAVCLCKGLVTNDSSPLHIAGAFDTKLVALMTIAHADFVLPYRSYGSKYHFTKAPLGEKLYATERDFSPHIKQQFMVDDAIPLDPKRHLPTPETVVFCMQELEK